MTCETRSSPRPSRTSTRVCRPGRREMSLNSTHIQGRIWSWNSSISPKVSDGKRPLVSSVKGPLLPPPEGASMVRPSVVTAVILKDPSPLSWRAAAAENVTPLTVTRLSARVLAETFATVSHGPVMIRQRTEQLFWLLGRLVAPQHRSRMRLPSLVLSTLAWDSLLDGEMETLAMAASGP